MVRILIDSHALTNIHKVEIESFGKICQSGLQKVIFGLCLSQLAIAARLFGRGNYYCAAIAFVLLMMTSVFGFLFRVKMVRASMYTLSESKKITGEALERWIADYSHPFAKEHEYREVMANAFCRSLLIPHGRNLV